MKKPEKLGCGACFFVISVNICC